MPPTKRPRRSSPAREKQKNRLPRTAEVGIFYILGVVTTLSGSRGVLPNRMRSGFAAAQLFHIFGKRNLRYGIKSDSIFALFFFWPAKFRPQFVPQHIFKRCNKLNINNIPQHNIFCTGTFKLNIRIQASGSLSTFRNSSVVRAWPPCAAILFLNLSSFVITVKAFLMAVSPIRASWI